MQSCCCNHPQPTQNAAAAVKRSAGDREKDGTAGKSNAELYLGCLGNFLLQCALCLHDHVLLGLSISLRAQVWSQMPAKRGSRKPHVLQAKRGEVSAGGNSLLREW